MGDTQGACGAERGHRGLGGVKRGLWALAGGLALLLGMVGAVLPLLPTVPFLLLAAFCFARASTRWHGWLMTHPRLGPPIRDWQDRGAVTRRAKGLATLWMTVSLVVSIALGVPVWACVAQSAVLIAVALFLWTRPE